MTTAMIFPGQGSQSVGMLDEHAKQRAIVGITFGQASDVLGYDLWKLVSEDPSAQLGQTQYTQPAILTASVALWRVWSEMTGSRPAFMAGHSLGEYSAMVCAGMMAFGDAVKLVETRGKLMQEAVPEGSGGMAAILSLSDEQVVAVCSRIAGVVEAVNFNSPGQVVIAGEREAVEKACVEAKAAGARRAQMLSVSVPAHSSLMKPAAEKFAVVLATVTIEAGTIPVLHNVGIDKVGTDPEKVRSALVAQLFSPVPWTDIVQELFSKGVDTTLECGPGKVLSGLVRRVEKSINTLPLQDPDGMKAAVDALA